MKFYLILSKTYYSQNFYLQSQHNYYLISISIFVFILLIPLISNGIFIVTFLVYSLKFICDIIKFFPQIYETIINQKSKSLSYNFVLVNLIGTFLKLSFLISESSTSQVVLLFLETILNTGLLSIMINYDFPNRIKFYNDKISNIIYVKFNSIKSYIKTFYENKNENKDKEMEDMSLIQNESIEEFEHDFEIV